MQEREVDVAVVGAGLAGLTTAHRLSAEGLSCLVLEARDRVGGRTLNQALGDGKVVEMGGQWIGVSQDRVYTLAAELGVDTFPTFDEGEEIAIVAGKRYRFAGEMPRMSPLVLADFAQTVMRFERLARTVPVDRPWEAPQARGLDGQTLRTWLERTAKTNRARSMLGLYLSTLIAEETANVSLLHALFYVHSGTSFEVMASITGGAQEERILGGSQVLSLRLAERLGADAVELGAPVRRVVVRAGAVRVESDRAPVTAKRLVIAVPPTLAARLEFDPPLPAHHDQLLQRLPQGTTIKVNAVYDEPFWRTDGLKGVAWSPDRPVSFVIDNSPPDGEPGVLLGFVRGDNARRLGREEPEARRKIVLDCLVDYHGSLAGAPIAYHELDWSSEPWTRGCFGAHFPPGVWTQYGPTLGEAVGPIHWAGSETSAVWNGYMDGAIRSGERAAKEVLASLA